MKPTTYLGHGYNPGRFHPGCLEVIAGPMKALKSGQFIIRVDAFNFSGGLEYIAFKPAEDTRTPGKIVSRIGALCDVVLEIPAVDIPKDNPEIMMDYIKDMHGLIGIDEAELFSKNMIPIVDYLLSQGRNVLISGLNMDFRGEDFGAMAHYILNADSYLPLFASCTHMIPDNSGKLVPCSQKAQYTQKLIDGEPAHYNSDIIVIEDKKSFLQDGSIQEAKATPRITYEPRCRHHHIVPGKPDFGFSELIK